MPRKGFVRRREPAADPKYDSVLVTRFINGMMETGKRSIAERHFYGAMTMVEQKTGQDAMTVLKMAMTNVKPMLEVKSRRVGGANYQVPVEVRPDRRNALATRWIIGYALERPDHTFAEKFAAEIMAAAKNEGGAVKKREDTHKMAEANPTGPAGASPERTRSESPAGARSSELRRGKAHASQGFRETPGTCGGPEIRQCPGDAVHQRPDGDR